MTIDLNKRYIIEAYQNDEFYGFFAPHPDDTENKQFSFYTDDVAEARTFQTPEEAERFIERFKSSDLELVIRDITKRYVFMVVQHQMDTEYDNKTIGVYSCRSIAEKKCIEYNKEYAQNVTWIEGEEYLEMDTYDEFYHYYTVEEIMMDR